MFVFIFRQKHDKSFDNDHCSCLKSALNLFLLLSESKWLNLKARRRDSLTSSIQQQKSTC